MLRNFQKLFSANLLAGILGLVTLTVVSRSLGPEIFGTLVVIISLGAFIEQIAGFQAWQAVTKYAAEAKTDDDSDRFWHIVSIGLALDIAGAIFAAILGAMATLLAADFFGLAPDVTGAATLYMLSIAFAFSGTPLAVLRIFDRYSLIGIVLPAMSAIKLLAVIAVSFFGLSFGLALAIIIVVNTLQHLTFLVLMLRVAREHGGRLNLHHLRMGDLRKFPGMKGFVTSVYLSTTIRNVAHEFDTVMLSAVTGPAIAGQYKLAKQYGSVVLRAVEPAQQVAYPRVAELVAGKNLEALGQLIRNLAALGTGFGLVVLLGYYLVGNWIVHALVGPEYDLVSSFLEVFIFTVAIFCALFFMRPLVLSFGRADAILLIYIVSTVVFVLTFYFSYDHLGPVSMMYAQVAFYVCWGTGMILTVVQSWTALCRAKLSIA